MSDSKENHGAEEAKPAEPEEYLKELASAVPGGRVRIVQYHLLTHTGERRLIEERRVCEFIRWRLLTTLQNGMSATVAKEG